MKHYNLIKKEVSLYDEQFKDKVVCCMNQKKLFWDYFYLDFKKLGLKKLICLDYNEITKETTIFRYNGVTVSQTKLNPKELFPLKNDIINTCDVLLEVSSFLSFDETIRLSLVSMKKFLILGYDEFLDCEDIQLLQKRNKLTVGYNQSVNLGFDSIDGYIKTKSMSWFTNLTKNKELVNKEDIKIFSIDKKNSLSIKTKTVFNKHYIK